MAVVADASELKVDPIVDGAFAGSRTWSKPNSQGRSRRHLSGMIISAAQRHAAWLHRPARGGRGHAVSTCSKIRGCIFRESRVPKRRCEISARRGWSESSICLATRPLEMRKQAPLAAVIAQRTLLSIAVNAKRRGEVHFHLSRFAGEVAPRSAAQLRA